MHMMDQHPDHSVGIQGVEPKLWNSKQKMKSQGFPATEASNTLQCPWHIPVDYINSSVSKQAKTL